MLFVYSLTVPADTTEVDPVTSTVSIAHGVLRHVSVSFPPGCAALCRVAVLYHESQIIPANRSEYLAWDALTISWPEEVPIHTVPYQLKLVGWNEDDTYPHTVTFRFDILEPEVTGIGRLARRLFTPGKV